jgi:hypothetical protein
MDDIHHGNSLRNTKNPSDKTIRGYMTSAAEAWKALTGMTVPLYEDPKDGERAKLKPIVADILSQHRNWKPTKQKREPYTFAMFQALNDFLCTSISIDGSVFLQERWAIFDWTRLGIFTGSRLAEYGQSKPTPGALFATVPWTTHAGEWAGTPLAFIRDDFTFYDDKFVQLLQSEATQDSPPRVAHSVFIRFRFDKSPTNFSIRKFRRISGTFLCPVKATISILRRADMLGIPGDFPIGAFRMPSQQPGEFTFIKGDNVKRVMQEACVFGHPDPNHYMRKHIHLIQSHSNRVTAAVAMFNAGVPMETIANRLRWSVESVKHYLRECTTKIGFLTERAIQGAMMT